MSRDTPGVAWGMELPTPGLSPGHGRAQPQGHQEELPVSSRAAGSAPSGSGADGAGEAEHRHPPGQGALPVPHPQAELLLIPEGCGNHCVLPGEGSAQKSPKKASDSLAHCEP